MNIFQKKIKLDDERVITLETGKLAKQADGAVVLKLGSTMFLATVVSAKEAKPDIDFVPLSVEYKEKFASLGKFPGGFLKRETRPSDYEILISRLIDRVLRPLFPKDYYYETFVTVNLISGDKETQPDALACLAASAALAVSDIPFETPVSEVRVARINNNLVINPSFSDMKNADIDLIVGASKDNIIMVEGEMKEVTEDEMLEALKFAHETIKIQCQAQIEFMNEVNKTEKRSYKLNKTEDEQLKKSIWEDYYQRVYDIINLAIANKQERNEKFNAIQEEILSKIDDNEDTQTINLALEYFYEIEKEAVRNLILNNQKRIDGRDVEEIRNIWSEVDYLPGTHGSAVFTRGETQSLTTVTLGSKLDEKIIDEAIIQGKEKFVLHYNFPPFSTGDARAARGISRREIGHGNLAHRAIKNILPDDTPYTIRIVSDILESNGSSSMATVCAATLALMDAGIQIKKPVSGIAMGLVVDKDNPEKFAILSDILGDEDHLGDMDFKITGTKDGITATQMDIKIGGISYEILSMALNQAKNGRLHILNKMLETLPEPRKELKPHSPRIVSFKIPKDAIGAVIGPGGKMIQEIQNTTNTVVVIEEVDDKHGLVEISGFNKKEIDVAIEKIKLITAKPEKGVVYNGKVKNIVEYGAFVEILPKIDGLLHISEIAHHHVKNVSDELKEGDPVTVKLIDIDRRTGKLKLSRKALLEK